MSSQKTVQLRIRRPAVNATGAYRTALPRRGITLVELLVVIAIIGVLVALILPAIEAARESSRRSACASNLRQLALAAKLHTTNHQTFPTGGWGEQWIGDPDGGYGVKQPGGWIYNILPYVEQQSLRDLGRSSPKEEKRKTLTKLMSTPLELFQCPSRRLPRVYPYNGPPTLENADPPEKVAKTDYAINEELSFAKSEVIPSNIQLARGLSNTVLIGEKSLAPANYVTGGGSGDAHCMYVGDSDDIKRRVAGAPQPDAGGGTGFGGPHIAGANIAYCDGSVRFIREDGELQPIVK